MMCQRPRFPKEIAHRDAGIKYCSHEMSFPQASSPVKLNSCGKSHGTYPAICGSPIQAGQFSRCQKSGSREIGNITLLNLIL